MEAEEPQEKSNFTIYPLFDKKSPATYPQDPIKVRLNTIGGGKWAAAGQWISWQVDIQESGYYQIAPRYRQDTYAGGYVSRRLEIDGKCPFEEAEAIRRVTREAVVAAAGKVTLDTVYFLNGKEG